MPEHGCLESQEMNMSRNKCMRIAKNKSQAGVPVPEFCGIHEPQCNMWLAALSAVERVYATVKALDEIELIDPLSNRLFGVFTASFAPHPDLHNYLTLKRERPDRIGSGLDLRQAEPNAFKTFADTQLRLASSLTLFIVSYHITCHSQIIIDTRNATVECPNGCKLVFHTPRGLVMHIESLCLREWEKVHEVLNRQDGWYRKDFRAPQSQLT
ncbi:MAG: hypothetical protein M1817_004522 [Caeruleum heppii]|nr:MAG: hypothetical protein M1817_004522 [Caeruleum heppii]